jgi:hypothetical protein
VNFHDRASDLRSDRLDDNIRLELGEAEKRGLVVTPAIEPMVAGDKPTEPGWYLADVASKDYPDRIIGEVIYLTTKTCRFMPGEWFIYNDDAWRIDDPEVIFIARIYPERIEVRSAS